MTLNFWFSCFHLSSAGITGVDFAWQWSAGVEHIDSTHARPKLYNWATPPDSEARLLWVFWSLRQHPWQMLPIDVTSFKRDLNMAEGFAILATSPCCPGQPCWRKSLCRVWALPSKSARSAQKPSWAPSWCIWQPVKKQVSERLH